MAITYGDHLIDSGYYDITPEQERELQEAEMNDATMKALKIAEKQLEACPETCKAGFALAVVRAAIARANGTANGTQEFLCPTCDGFGTFPATGKVCETCDGAGTVEI